MKYLEFHFTLNPASSDFTDVLESVLVEVGFESFVKKEDQDVLPSDLNEATGDTVIRTPLADLSPLSADASSLTAYVQRDIFDKTAFQAAIDAFPIPGISITYDMQEAEDRDWNAEWEQNYFQPLVVDERCVVSATFHKDVPSAEYNIKINPRMSFGTGHHETTRQMLRAILAEDIEGKDVLDMGCGTCILGILAAMRGARSLMAIDIDEWCVENSRENLALNGISCAEVLHGTAEMLPATPNFDLILANIHLNIIRADLPRYAACLRSGGLLFTSGFYESDLSAIREAAEAAGLSFVRSTSENNWCCAIFRNVVH